MYQGQIIDTHMHLWDIANGYEWLPGLAEGKLRHNFLMSDYLKVAERQSISQTVHIECGGFPKNRVLETKWVQQQADRYGGPQAIVAFAQLDSPDVETVLKEHRQYPNLRGIRMPLNQAGNFGAERDDYMRDKEWRKGYALLSKHNLHFEMQIYDTQLPEAVDLAKSYADILLVLQHLGWPLETTSDYMKKWKERLAPLAECPNVYIKLSCLGWIFQTKDEKKILPFLQEAINLFGVDRCIVGSNYPPDKIYLSFDEIFHILKTALSSYSEKEQEKIFYGNAKRLYRL